MLRPIGTLLVLAMLSAATSCSESDAAARRPTPRADAAAGDGSTAGAPLDAATAENDMQDAALDGGGISAERDAMAAPDATLPEIAPDAASPTPADASVPQTPDAFVPPAPEPLADCEASPIAFDTQPPAAATGLVAIDLSSWLQPVGARERALISVFDDQYRLDSSYHGELVWTLPDGVEIVAATPISGGQAEVTFRFTRAGTFELAASLTEDPRSGRATVVAYVTQLPVWELTVDPAALEALYADPLNDAYIPGVLSIAAVRHELQLRLHGGSSRDFVKRSFRFDLADTDPQPPPYGKKLILRAEWSDKTQLRNWLALRMVRAATSLPTPRSKLVHFRINDRYYGVMHNVERIGGPFLRAWGMADTGSLYEADPPRELALPGANLTPLSPELYAQVYQHHAGSIDYLDLRKLIEETLTLPDPELAMIAEDEIMVDEYIQYLAALAAIQDQDQVRKNYYLYRGPQSSDRWRVLPWDLDLTLGHLWSEQSDVLDEQIVTDSDIFVGAYDPVRGDFYNQLTERVLRFPAYRARFREQTEQMLGTSMARAEAQRQLQAAVRCMTPDLVADVLKRASNAEYQGRVTEILDFLDARRAYVSSLPR